MADDEAMNEVAAGQLADDSAKGGAGSGRKRRKKKGRQGKGQQVEMVDPAQAVKARFAACGRCCYFLGGYVSANGDGELVTAVQDGSSDWLTLTWNQHTRNLVHKTFGVRLDVDYYFYEGCCVACSRQFAFRMDEAGQALFRVQT